MLKSFLLQTFLYLSVTILYSSGVVTGFQWPSNLADIAIYSKITATATCSISDVQCNSTCPTRTDFPKQELPPLKNASPNCTTKSSDPGIPSNVNKTNGIIEFNGVSVLCNSVTTTYSDVELFTISMWINVNCSNCVVLKSNTSILLQMVNGVLSLNNVNQAIKKASWHFVVLRYDTSLSWYIGNHWKGSMTPSPTLSSAISVSLGPNTNLTDQEYIKIADVRFYKDALTEREIVSLYTGTFQSLPMDSPCRCPSTHPGLVNETFPKQYMACTNGTKKVSRFNVDAKFSEFLNDNDTSTSWHSGTVNTVSVTMVLGRSFQLHRLTLEDVTRKPAELKIVTYNGSKQMTTFSQNCQSDSACKTYSFTQNSNMLSYEFDGFLNETSSVTREKYETVVADKIVIVINTNEFFTSSEIRLIVRCNCYGNDGTCTVSGNNYTCKCAVISHTEGDNCQHCSSSFYRQTNLNCNIPCACDKIGRNSASCEEVTGECDCKKNVIGRKCDSCKHNTADLSASGCAACSCNPDGITSCSDGGVCNCKKHVETDSGTCMECLPDFYNIRHSAGCLPCNCNRVGTDVKSLQKCDNSTGQCNCKNLTEGRKCDTCKNGSYDLSPSHALRGCIHCDCNFVGSIDDNCDKVTGACNCRMKRNSQSQRNCQPTRLNLDPKYGPMAGSTLLTISGQDLGSLDVKLSFNIDGSQQTVTKRNDTHIFITTKSTSSEGQKDIRLYWVQGNRPDYNADFNQEVKFEYRKDPVIAAASKSPRNSYASGGCTLRFQGTSLNSVAYPKLLVNHSSVSMESPCTGNTRLLSCVTPNLTQYGPNTTLTYGFYLDGVTMYRAVSTIDIVDDPYIETGKEEDFKHLFDDVFKIMGSNLDLACHDEDVAILFDGEKCKLLSRTNNYISCDPNEKFPGQSRKVEVKVKMGNWMMVWGHLNMKSFWNTTEFILIAVGVCVFVLIIVVMVCFIWRCRRHKTQQSDFHELEEIKGKRIRNPYENNPVAIVTPLDGQRHIQNKHRSSTAIVGDFCDRLNSTTSKIVKASLVDRSHIEIGKICTNKGSLTRVVNGTYNVTSSSPDSGSNLTIKTLVDTYPEEGHLPVWLNAGLAECTRLQDFSHENVLRMMGITVDLKNVYILYPEMSNRTLKDYLCSAVEEPLADGLKMNMCLQIAMGMNYLSAEGITHKDLAARNCWVTADDVIKVGDASFAYDLYPHEYLNNGGRYQPVRWMAPESLNQGFYDTKSDVWSFGVVVWEVYTNGYLPYHDITSNKEVKEKVCRDHFRLGKPHNCSDQMFKVIEDCHFDDVDNRPNFFLVVNTIESVINPDPVGTTSYVNDPTEDAIYSNLTDPPPIPRKGRMK